MILKFFKTYFAIMIMGIAVILSGASLMIVSQNVFDKQAKIKRMEDEALATEWEIRALNAELAFLSRPDRMDQLASAMAQTISPVASNDIMLISPASYSPFSPISLSVIPNRKPSPTRVSTRVSSNVTTVAQNIPQKQPKPSPTKETNFLDMLNNIGGDE